jgi:hypothetical protein
MKYVDERLAVYDPDKLGFPSIGSCHAIVYHTTHALYGYHNFGGETADRWKDAPSKFGNFVIKHGVMGEAGLGFYGVAHVSTNRGYPGDKRVAWLAELTAFAHCVGWYGSIQGYDLGGFTYQQGYDNTKSAYVEFRRMGRKCLIYTRQWIDHENVSGPPDGSHEAIARPSLPGVVTTSLKGGGGTMHNVEPETLS